MRKIKFRIYDRAAKKFHYSYDKGCVYDGIGMTINDVDGFLYRLERVQQDPNLVLQQFTGAFDKNGVEIYEGDVVELGAGWFYDFDRVATVDWDEEDCVFYCYWSTPDLGARKTELHDGKDCAVIGNIFLDNHNPLVI